MTLRATRLSNSPIIAPHMDRRMGDNINGPSLIRVPEWIKDPLGTYYLYFADHKGTYIRLAYSDSLTGPWTMYESGTLDVAESLFEAADPPEPAEVERPAWAGKMVGGYLYAHIASPDVHVDDNAQIVRMYYHGLLRNGDQLTRLATSSDGIHFIAQKPLLGPPYFRAFRYEGHIYAIAWGGSLLRATNWGGPFKIGPNLVAFEDRGGIGHGFRHGEVHCVGDRLHLFYHRMGDRPERIMHSRVNLHGDWMTWTASRPRTILKPELDWEGADLPLHTSRMGGVDRKMRELRDPCIFKDSDGQTYLLYCGGGENGIGIAMLEGL